MSAKLSFLFPALFAVVLARTQSPYPNVLIVSEESSWHSYPPCEPSVFVSPKNPANVVVGTILNGFHASADSGRTWMSGTLRSSLGVYGDPCITGNRRGDFYYCHLGDPAGQGWGSPSLLDCIVCQRSKDGGRTWSDGAAAGYYPPRDQDKEWATTSRDSRYVYMSWTQFDKYESKNPLDSTNILFARARRKMRKWSEAVRINQYAGDCSDDDGTAEGAVPASGPRNQVYVAWALGENIWFDRSRNRGRDWLDRDILVTRIPGGWNQDIPGIGRANGMPVLVSDLSGGPRNGWLYLCWSDTRNGTDNTDIFFCSSPDEGETWTEPVRINDDSGRAHQFFPWICVDQATGVLYAVYYDRRRSESIETDVYLATSGDGGKTWKNERISESPFVPTPEVFFGDYNNISAHDGVVRPVWTRCDSGKLSVWTALINR
jgi:hypothetical protein